MIAVLNPILPLPLCGPAFYLLLRANNDEGTFSDDTIYRYDSAVARETRIQRLTANEYCGPFKPFKTFNGSTVREASRQASSTAFSSEPGRGITMTGSIFRSFLR